MERIIEILNCDLEVVIEELKIIKNKYSTDFDLIQRVDNSIRLLEKWF